MLQKVHIRLAENRVNSSVAIDRRTPKIFTPGEIISEQKEFMRLVFMYIATSISNK